MRTKTGLILAAVIGTAMAVPGHASTSCNLVTDPTADSTLTPNFPMSGQHPPLELVKADLATKGDAGTVSITVADLDGYDPVATPLGMNYVFKWTGPGAKLGPPAPADTYFVVVAEIPPDWRDELGKKAATYRIGYAFTNAGASYTEILDPGRKVSGSFDPATNQIKVHFRIRDFVKNVKNAGSMKTKAKQSNFTMFARAQNWQGAMVDSAYAPKTSTYPIGNKSCLKVG